MAYLRILRSRCWVVSISITVVFIYLLCFFKPPSSTTSSSKIRVPKRIPGPLFNRLSRHRKQLLSSVIAHVRIGYVANRTPDIDTPPLLITATCQEHNKQQCGKLADRLVHITNAYYFSMLLDGSAFAFDMSWPVPFEWFFEPTPVYMALSSDRAEQYIQNAQRSTVVSQGNLTAKQLSSQPFMQDYTSQSIKVVRTEGWTHQGDWIQLQNNPTMSAMRDKYRLNHISLKSDWFFIVSRLLFAKPTGWLQTELEPYRDLMGGHLQWGESLSPWDPANHVSPHIKNEWFRVGIRMTGTKQDANCIANYVASVCRRAALEADEKKACHVFISSADKTSLNLLRKELRRYIKSISIHAVAERYPFRELDEALDGQEQHARFESNEHHLKSSYARTFMDWILLSRMDYLVGQMGDGFITTAAWAAQVQTDVKVPAGDVCRVMAMTEW